MPDLVTLRARHPMLTFKSVQQELLGTDWRVTFHFHLAPDIDFAPTLTWHQITPAKLNNIPPQLLDELLLAIGMVEMLSYWKAACPPIIDVEAGPLTPDQTAWWQHLLLNGLGEFFYQNQIDFTAPDFVQIKSSVADKTTQPSVQPTGIDTTPQRVLIPLGGGKDSAVSAHLLQQQKLTGQLSDLATWAINSTPTVQHMAEQLQLPMLTIDRQLDPQLLKLNQAGYLNGHTPFSALLAFTSLLTAWLNGFDTVAISNEHSANEGNVNYLGHNINHQYSKSFEFEKSLATYTANWAGCPRYISLLRPLNELQIARLFAPLTDLHPIFVSCNRQTTDQRWCGQCPKCLSTFACLFPFLGEKAVVQIFGRNLWQTSELTDLLNALLGLTPAKPFECVLSFDEMRAAVQLASEWYLSQQLELPVLLKQLRAKPQLNLEPQQLDQLLTKINTEHRLPASWLTMLTANLNQTKLPNYV